MSIWMCAPFLQNNKRGVNMYRPYTYDELNILGSHYTPQPVKAFDNKYYKYWCRSLVQRMQSALILDTPWKANELNFLYWFIYYSN